jgi:hypothetical protein
MHIIWWKTIKLFRVKIFNGLCYYLSNFSSLCYEMHTKMNTNTLKQYYVKSIWVLYYFFLIHVHNIIKTYKSSWNNNSHWFIFLSLHFDSFMIYYNCIASNLIELYIIPTSFMHIISQKQIKSIGKKSLLVWIMIFTNSVLYCMKCTPNEYKCTKTSLRLVYLSFILLNNSFMHIISPKLAKLFGIMFSIGLCYFLCELSLFMTRNAHKIITNPLKQHCK